MYLFRDWSDPVHRARLLWLSMAWIMAAVFLILGSAYIFGGIRVTLNSSAYSYVSFGWGQSGMRLHGALMIAHGLALGYGLLSTVYGLPELRRWLHRALFAVCGYSWWLVCAFGAPWVLNGVVTIGPMVTWLAFGSSSVALLILSPPKAYEYSTLSRAASRGVEGA
jgi:hypothetical protein